MVISRVQQEPEQKWCSYILVGDNLDVLDMTSSLKDLAQDILGDSLVETSDVQSPLVRLRSSTGGGHDATVLAHGRGHASGDGVVAGVDVQRRGGIAGAVLRRRSGSGRSSSGSVSHGGDVY